MKTTFDTDEDKIYLRVLLERAVMQTENVYNFAPDVRIKEYVLYVLDLRAKAFEYLGYEDYNEAFIKEFRRQ